MNFIDKIVLDFLLHRSHKAHDHLLRYKYIKINTIADLTDKPHRIIYEEFDHEGHGVWYEECQVEEKECRSGEK